MCSIRSLEGADKWSRDEHFMLDRVGLSWVLQFVLLLFRQMFALQLGERLNYADFSRLGL